MAIIPARAIFGDAATPLKNMGSDLASLSWRIGLEYHRLFPLERRDRLLQLLQRHWAQVVLDDTQASLSAISPGTPAMDSSLTRVSCRSLITLADLFALVREGDATVLS